MSVPAVQLPLETLIAVLEEAKVIAIMSAERRRLVTVDYVAPRDSMAIPREDPEVGLEAYPITPIPITFVLEDAMFGGVIYAAITCGHRVIVNPFKWSSYDALGKLVLRPR